MLQNFNQLDIAKDSELIELHELLGEYKRDLIECEAKLKGEIIKRMNGQKSLQIGEYKITNSQVFRKVFSKPVEELLNTCDAKFVKLEYKPNTAVINEYMKKNRRLPTAISEVYSNDMLRITKIKPKEETVIDEKVKANVSAWLDKIKKK